jgi:hypothetical protein
MTPAQLELDRHCRAQGITAAVRARIVRLNPDYKPGAYPRGYHPQPNRYLRVIHNLVSKGEFIHRFGFGAYAWSVIPNGVKWRDGRRQYVERRFVEDNGWRVWAGLDPPAPMMAWYPTKKYANDNDCVVEYISAEEFLRRRQAA